MLLYLALLAAPHTAPPLGVTPPRLREGEIGYQDYPLAAIQANEQGSVRILLSVTPDGKVAACSVTEPSGSAVLDATTCSIVRQRYRFDPARNRAGEPVRSQYSQTVRWQLPKDEPPVYPPFAYGELRIFLAMSDQDPGCAVEAVGAVPELAQEICPERMRVEVQRLTARRDVVMQVATVMPDGATAGTRQPIRGTLLGSGTAAIEVDNHGRVASCREIDSVTGEVSPPPICTTLTAQSQMFEPAPAGQVRRGQVRLELYRMGAPET